MIFLEFTFYRGQRQNSVLHLTDRAVIWQIYINFIGLNRFQFLSLKSNLLKYNKLEKNVQYKPDCGQD
jgi:hypothetical protein